MTRQQRQGGSSLNDCLHKGPSLTPLLFDILIRFQEKRVALIGNIEKAFLNIKLDKPDRDFLRFLWPENVSDPESTIAVYRFCRVVLGLNMSPRIKPFLCTTNSRIEWHAGASNCENG